MVKEITKLEDEVRLLKMLDSETRIIRIYIAQLDEFSQFEEKDRPSISLLLGGEEDGVTVAVPTSMVEKVRELAFEIALNHSEKLTAQKLKVAELAREMQL